MKNPLPSYKSWSTALLLGCLLTAVAHADAWEDAVAQREQSLKALRETENDLDRQLGRDSEARKALDQAVTGRRALDSALNTAKDKASGLGSAEFKVKFLKTEWESAQREAKRLDAAKDARYDELMQTARAENANKQADLDQRRDRLNAWFTQVQAKWDAWKAFRDQIEPLMRTYETPREQAEFEHAQALERQRNAMRAACEAEDKRYNVARDAWISDRDNLKGTWEARLADIEKFSVEEGKRVLQATALASKKEREYYAAVEKFTKLQTQYESALGTYDQNYATVAGTLSALSTVQSISSTVSNATTSVPTPYTARATAESANAQAPQPETVAVTPMAEHVFVLPPATAIGSAETVSAGQRQAADMLATAVAGQFAPAAPVTTVAPAANTVIKTPPQTTADPVQTPPAPAVFIGPAPLAGSGAGDDGSAVVVLDEAALHRVFHPGIFISDAQYAQAQAIVSKNEPWITKLEAQIERLRNQRGGLAANQTEFAELRREIAVGAMREVLGVYATRMDMLLKDEKLMATFTASQIHRLETAKRAFDTAKLGLVLPHAGATPNGREADALRMEAWEEGSAALAELAASQVPNAFVREFLGQGGNLLKAGGKLNRHVHDPNRPNNPFPQDLKASIDAVGAFCPPVALGVGLEAVGERGLQWAVTKDAVDSLSAGVNTTDEAIVYLSAKLERSRTLARDARELIANHNAARARTTPAQGAQP